MIALLGAFGQEIAGLRRQMAVEEVVDSPACRVYRGQLRGKPCILVQTGIGRQRAEKATQFVLERYPVTAIDLSRLCRSSDSRSEDWRRRRMLNGAPCVRIREGRGGGRSRMPPMPTCSLWPPRGPGDGSTRFLAATCVTTPGVVSGARAKQELSREFQAQVVDMESYWIAGVASARRVPFIAIRSISDTLQDDLRAVDHILDSEGRVLWKRVVPYFLLHPHHLPSMFTAFRNMRRAERSLTAFISDLVTRI